MKLRQTAWLLLGLLALAACQRPPEAAFVADSVRATAGQPAGANALGEPCTAAPATPPALGQPNARATNIYCGGWSQPSARLVTLGGGATDVASLQRLASASPWRQALAERLLCEDAAPTRLAGGTQAVLLRCVRRRGGWPHLALVAAGPDGPVLADGLPAALPVVERLVSGTGPRGGEPRSAAMEIAVSRLAAEAYGAADASRYDQLMALAHDLNQAEKFAAAEDAYRAALAIQQRVIGAENPNTVGPLLALALNVSSQGRDASLLFQEAAAFAPRAANPLIVPRLLHYRGMDRLNQGDAAAALPLLEQAEAAYLRVAPAALAALDQRDADPGSALQSDTLVQSAVLGLAEARRYRGIALARDGQPEAADRALRDSRRLLRNAGLDSGVLVGRNLRSRGGALDPEDTDQAARFYAASALRFAAAQPGERPEATTQFLAGGRLLAEGDRAQALDWFAQGEAVLRQSRQGLPTEQVMPYLDALAAEAAEQPAQSAALQARMFEVAQLARRETTARLVAQAAARLNASGGDSQVGSAVRRLQDAERTLRSLLLQRDQASGATAALDARIAAAEAHRAEAENEVAAAAPGYRQLLLTVATAAAVSAALAPGEVMVSMLLGPAHGYAFALTPDGAVVARRIALADKAAAALVARIRRGTQPTAQGLPEFDLVAAAQLHRAVLAPLGAPVAEASSLLVAADGPLLSLPFGLLLTAEPESGPLGRQPWLVRRQAVVHVPSAETLVAMRGAGRGAASAAPLTYAGFADPVPPGAGRLQRSFPASRCGTDAAAAAGLAPLPGTRAEVLAAAKVSGARPDALRMGAAFTAETLRAQHLERYRVLHFATHALMSGELHCLTEPAMLVSVPTTAKDAAGAFVPASAFMELRMDADLVILSACNTGTTGGSSALGGEGLSALVRASFFAGARGVLATHWVLDDEAASRMVSRMVGGQLAGQGSAAALRAVQVEMLDKAGDTLPERWAHPYYWAPFALLGDGLRTARRS